MPSGCYVVHHENGGTMTVIAKDKRNAIEQYYHALEGILGHQMGICACFGERKPIDRAKVARPTLIEGPLKKSSASV